LDVLKAYLAVGDQTPGFIGDVRSPQLVGPSLIYGLGFDLDST
jgi:hypothetical protein